MTRADAIVERARSVVGARFRPQGREPALGLDCLGVAAFAAAVAPGVLPRRYTLRGEARAEIEHGLRRFGFEPVDVQSAAAGDILLAEAGPQQLHFAVHTGSGLVHADAGLRRVVERPLPCPWPIVGAWRSKGNE